MEVEKSVMDKVLDVVATISEPITCAQVSELSGIDMKSVSGALYTATNKGRVRREKRPVLNALNQKTNVFFYLPAAQGGKLTNKIRKSGKGTVMGAINSASAILVSGAITAMKQGKYADAKAIITALEKLK